MLNASAAQLHSIIATTEKVGGKVPTEILKAYARYQKVNAALGKIYVGGNALPAAILAAIDHDRDPAADPEVQRILTSQQAGHEGISGIARSTVLQEFAQTVASNASKLVGIWQEPFEAAAQTIRDTAKKLGPVKLSDSESILRAGGDSAEQWTRASQADRVIDEITGAWTLMALQTGFAPDNRRNYVLRFADPSLEQWDEHNLDERRLSAWDANQLGLPLSLADGPEYVARAQRLQQAREARAIAHQHRETGKRTFA